MEQRESPPPPPSLQLHPTLVPFPHLSLRPYCTSKVRPCFLHRRRRSGQTCSMRKFRVVPVSENVLERNTRMWSTKTGAVSEPPKSPSSTRVLASGSMERERSDRVRKVPEADDAARAPVSAAAHAAESRSESSAPLSSLASDICDTAFGPRSALVVVVWVVVWVDSPSSLSETIFGIRESATLRAKLVLGPPDRQCGEGGGIAWTKCVSIRSDGTVLLPVPPFPLSPGSCPRSQLDRK